MNDEEFFKIIDKTKFDKALKVVTMKAMENFVDMMTWARTPEYLNLHVKCDPEELMSYAVRQKWFPILEHFNDTANNAAKEIKDLVDSGNLTIEKLDAILKQRSQQITDGSVDIPID